MSGFGQSEVSPDVTLFAVDGLKHLRQEYEENRKSLRFPLNIEDYDRLKERSKVIGVEANALAKSLNIPNLTWFIKGYETLPVRIPA